MVVTYNREDFVELDRRYRGQDRTEGIGRLRRLRCRIGHIRRHIRNQGD
jgi:hypothetical protein